MKEHSPLIESNRKFGSRAVTMLHNVQRATCDVSLIQPDRPVESNENIRVLLNGSTVPKVRHAGTSRVAFLDVSIELLRRDDNQLALQGQSFQ